MSAVPEPVVIEAESLAIQHVPGSLRVVETAKAFQIHTTADYEAGAELLTEIKKKDRAAEDFFKPLKQKQDEAKRAILDGEKKVRGPLAEAEGIIKTKLSAYDTEQERLRRIEEARLTEIARIEDESRRLAEAQAVVSSGGTQEEALAVIDEPSFAPAPIVEKATPKVAGISYRESYDAERVTERITDDELRWHLAHKEHRAALIYDVRYVRPLAKSQKEAFGIAGWRIVKRKIVMAGVGR